MAKKTETKKITEDTSPVSGQSRASFAIFMLVFLLCLAVGVAGYFYYQYQHVSGKGALDVSEVTKLTEEIRMVMELPDGETPTLATVTDTQKLADQPFFQKAQNGDKVLIYTNNGRAILYRPSVKSGERGKIVDVTTINVTPQAVPVTPETPLETPSVAEALPESTLTPDVTPEMTFPSIALYNGTAKKGLTQKYETELVKAHADIVIVAKESASKSDYDQTLVIDLTGKQSDLAKTIATEYGVTVTSLPTGEVVPSADILIIYGTDRL